MASFTVTAAQLMSPLWSMVNMMRLSAVSVPGCSASIPLKA